MQRFLALILISSLWLADSGITSALFLTGAPCSRKDFAYPLNFQAVTPWIEFVSHPFDGKRSREIQEAIPKPLLRSAPFASQGPQLSMWRQILIYLRQVLWPWRVVFVQRRDGRLFPIWMPMESDRQPSQGHSVGRSSMQPSGPVMLTGSQKPTIETYSLFWALKVLTGKDDDGRTPRTYDMRTRMTALANLFIQIRTSGIKPVEHVLGEEGIQRLLEEWEEKWLPGIQAPEMPLEDPGLITELIAQFHKPNVHYLSEIDPSKLRGRRVLVREDFNDIHVEPNQNDVDDIRLNAAKETLEYLLRNGARVIVATHSGRPTGEGLDPRYPVDHVGEAVGRLLSMSTVPVVRGRELGPGRYAVVTDEVVRRAAALQPGEILVLDNLRFDWRERSSDPREREGLAADLAAIADIFVLDGFPISHRPDASVTEMHKVLPSVAGFWLERELREHEAFLRLMEAPTRGPMAALFGGSKPDKWSIINAFVNHMRAGDKVLLAGTVADFISSHHSSEIARWRERGLQVVLASDSIDGKDIGPGTIDAFRDALHSVGMVYWNGPVGVFETPPYQSGSEALAKEIKAGLDGERYSHVFVSGGETAFVVKSALGLTERTRHGVPGLYISTGGGTSTDFFAFGRNMGLESLWGISNWYRRPSVITTDLSPFLTIVGKPLRLLRFGLLSLVGVLLPHWLAENLFDRSGRQASPQTLFQKSV